MIKVAKFGGTSMSNAEAMRRCADIVKSEDARRYVVVSAPGKRVKGDEKVTDMLYAAQSCAAAGEDCTPVFDKIEERFLKITADLGLSLDLKPVLADIKARIGGGADAHYAASRGEYLSAMVFAAYIGYDFIDAAEVVKFASDGSFDDECTNDLMSAAMKSHKRAVFPGFYGALPSGQVRTFSRGGSD
ncbi:MAG: aspartate kinase, partial [Clostridiales bacterium]|nr:aspartate kinase [Clostridiales bacterium]